MFWGNQPRLGDIGFQRNFARQMSRNRENEKKKKQKTQTHFAKQRTIETFCFASLARSLKKKKHKHILPNQEQ